MTFQNSFPIRFFSENEEARPLVRAPGPHLYCVLNVNDLQGNFVKNFLPFFEDQLSLRKISFRERFSNVCHLFLHS